MTFVRVTATIYLHPHPPFKNLVLLHSMNELEKILKLLDVDNCIMYRDRKIYDVSD